jgi:hypothetical protein
MVTITLQSAHKYDLQYVAKNVLSHKNEEILFPEQSNIYFRIAGATHNCHVSSPTMPCVQEIQHCSWYFLNGVQMVIQQSFQST